MRLLFGVTLLAISGIATAAELRAPHVRVDYEGITQPQAAAIANTVSAASSVLPEEFGLTMPASVTVYVSIGRETKLASGCKDGNNSICLELATPRHLDPPMRSGYYNLYGLCHELGHIAWAMNMHGLYIFNGDGNEGWAHYIGSVLVDRLYESKGPALWFEEYDYRSDGTARLRHSLTESPSAVDRSAGAFLALEQIIGRRGPAKLFPPLYEATHNATSATLSKEIESALTSTFADHAEELKGWWHSYSGVLSGRSSNK
jgi:hypothetical protein